MLVLRMMTLLEKKKTSPSQECLSLVSRILRSRKLSIFNDLGGLIFYSFSLIDIFNYKQWVQKSLIYKQFNLSMTDIFSQTSIDSEFLSHSTPILNKEQYITVKRGYAELKIKIFPWTTIQDLKRCVASMVNSPSITYADVRLFHKTIELSQNGKNVHDYNVVGNGAMVVEIRKALSQGKKSFINPYNLFKKPEQKVKKLIENTTEALKHGKVPELTDEGTSGAYIIQNKKNKRISIFKPFDEQVNAPNNPRGRSAPLGSDGICKGILSGECATRQVAAYLLDSLGQGFHGVPTTTYIQFYHPNFTNNDQLILSDPIPSLKEHTTPDNKITKHGSLQEFIASEGIIGDYGIKRFPKEQIQKIAILDIRILNCDRNDGNILVRQANGQLELVPIDHGLSFSDSFQIYEDSIFWMSAPQCKKPFSAEQLAFINQINPIQDVSMLSEKLGFREICLRNFRIAQTFLKKAANFGFTLYQIGKMLYRADDDDLSSRSQLQNVVIQAQDLYLNMKANNLLMELQESEDDDDLEETSETIPQFRNVSFKKKISLPQLQKKTTSFYERKNLERKLREGINGVGKTIWNKYRKQKWSEDFYHYFENLLDTFLSQKRKQKM